MATKSLELDINRMAAMRNALRALDGREAIVGEGAAARVVVVPYKLGALRHTIAKNLGVLRPHLDAFEEARNGVLREVSGRAPFIDSKAEPDKFKFFNDKVDEMIKEAGKIAVQLETFAPAALKLDVNEIPPDVIDALADLIE